MNLSFSNSTSKKRLVGVILILLLLASFFSFNRFPKLDTVREDLGVVFSPTNIAASSSTEESELPETGSFDGRRLEPGDEHLTDMGQAKCFQGFCIEGIEEDTKSPSLIQRWVIFSVTYLRLVTIGMIFAFLMAGVAEAFLFSDSSGKTYESGSVFKRTIKGLAAGPVLNLCSACIVPISSTFRGKGGGIAGAISMVQGSATLNIPALAMAFFVFTPLLGFSRLILAVIGGLLIGPIVVMATRRGASNDQGEEPVMPTYSGFEDTSPWGAVLQEGFRDWARVSIGYLIRLGPIMIVAGFGSGLVMQWLTVDTAETYLGNHVLGVALAATFGILINVPLLFEIPLVALLLLLGMGTAPAATLLFTAAAGGPVTFWGLAKVMPRRAIATFATATWAVGAFGGFAILAFGTFIWDGGSNLRVEASVADDTAKMYADSTTETAVSSPSEPNFMGKYNQVFTNVTVDTGIDFVHVSRGEEELEAVGGGAVILDFDGDGLDDLFALNSVGPNALYRNNGDSTFTDLAHEAGIDDPDGWGNGGCAADYDNDGDQDLYVTNYGNSKLFQNDGNGLFIDMTSEAKLGDPDATYRSTGCAWGDYDSDGYLDLVVVRHLHEWSPFMLDTGDFYAGVRRMVLHRSIGDGTFSDVSTLLNATEKPNTVGHYGPTWGAGFQPVWLDFDNDGDPDLYIANDFGSETNPNVLWRNDGPGTNGDWYFEDISEISGAGSGIYSMGVAVGDYNLDGVLDLFVTNINDNLLLENDGNSGTFKDVASETGTAVGLIGNDQRVSWGAAFLDYDNDGDEDLYVVSGYLKPHSILFQPNVLLRNELDGTFTNVSFGSGADSVGIGRGGVYLDFDNDGCLDLFVVNYGEDARLYRNLCEWGNTWLRVKTVGTRSNRDGIGARIKISAGGVSQIREIRAGSSSMGQNTSMAHFGLGTHEIVETIEIIWPSGIVQKISDVEANQILQVTEPTP
jgi:uncharacterized membrane protein YraQ (UPF0718 family)